MKNKDSFYSNTELAFLGLKRFGNNVLISKKASFYGCSDIEIGNNVRIDDFCVLSGKIVIKDYVHISLGSSLIAGDAGIEIGNHCCISVKSSVFAISDNFSGDYLVGPLEPEFKRNVIKKKVIINDFSVIGANSVLLPGAYIGKGVAVGALSLVKTRLKSFSIYCGSPCRRIKDRSKKMLKV